MTSVRKTTVMALSCMSLLAACSSASTGAGASGTTTPSPTASSATPTTSTPDATSSSPSAAADGPVSISVSVDAGLKPEALAAIDKQIGQFQSKYPNITVKRVEYTWTAPTFAAKLVGGTLPTVFTFAFTDGRALIAQHQIADISAEVAKLPYAAAFNKNVAAEGSSADGKIEAIPISAYGNALHYNRTMFKAAGLDPDKPPTSWDEVRADAKKIADATHQAGYAHMTQGNTGGWILSTEAYAHGGRMESEDGKTATVNNDGTKKALALLHDMRWTDNSLGANFGYDWPGINQAFAAGRVGMYITGGGTYQNLVLQNNIKPDDYGLSILPLDGDKAAVLGGGTLAAVNVKASPAEQAAAVKWIDWYYLGKITTEEGAVLDAKTNAEAKNPVGSPQLPIFDKATFDKVTGWTKQYVNVPLNQMAPYTSQADQQPLVPEPSVETQKLYGALDPVVQAVLTNKDANIDQLLTDANAKVQAILDKAK